MATLFTPFATDATTKLLPAADTEDGRVVFELEKFDVPLSEEWNVWVAPNGSSYEVRVTDCGSGCRCAAEIRSPY